MTLSVIAALARNGVIGRDGGLPWHLPDDLRRFKRLTMGHVVIVGRKTYASIGKPLPGRRIIVLTRNPAFDAPGIETATSLESALQLAAADREIFVAGGAEVYATALPHAHRLYLTIVHADVKGDVTFPHVDFGVWNLVKESTHDSDDRHAHRFTFRDYDKRGEKRV